MTGTKEKKEIGFTELLHAVTVNSKDDGKKFQTFNRINVIKELLADSAYQLRHEGDLSLIYSKMPLEGQEVVLISSHIDCVYNSCFCEDCDNLFKGTFDNSLTNAAVLYNMLHNQLDDGTVVAFTGDEEKDSAGCWEVMRTLKQSDCFVKGAIVTEVTNEGWNENSLFTIENDLGIDLLTAHALVEGLKPFAENYVLIHEAEPDESWDLDTIGIPCLSLCYPVEGDMHSDAGVLARKAGLPVYCRVLALLTAIWNRQS